MSKPLRVELAVVGRHVVMACTGTMPEAWRGGGDIAPPCPGRLGVESHYHPCLGGSIVFLPGGMRERDRACDQLAFKSRKAARVYFDKAREAVMAAMERMYGDDNWTEFGDPARNCWLFVEGDLDAAIEKEIQDDAEPINY